MARTRKTLSQMNADSLRYLAEHTDITYLSEGSYARGLIEATNLNISHLQEYIATTRASTYLNSATGAYLDLIGDMLRTTRNGASRASVNADDMNIQLSVVTGVLGDYFPNPSNANLGLIRAGFRVTTIDGAIDYYVEQDIEFSRNLTELYIGAVAGGLGVGYNVGRNKLVVHNGPQSVNVTNLRSISNGSSSEPDKEYRYRLANKIAGSYGSNETAIRLAILGNPDVSSVRLREFARGAGTFDALLVPIANTVSRGNKNIVQAAIDSTAAFGISGRAVEPKYISFKITVQLIPNDSSGAGIIDASRLDAKSAILDYMEGISIGGELIINRLRAAIIDAVSQNIKDIKIIDLCFNGRPHVIRNYKLKPDELFTPDMSGNRLAIEVV